MIQARCVLFQQIIIAAIVQAGFFVPVRRWVGIHWGVWDWKSPRLGYIMVATHVHVYRFLHRIVRMLVSRSTQALSGGGKKTATLHLYCMLPIKQRDWATGHLARIGVRFC